MHAYILSLPHPHVISRRDEASPHLPCSESSLGPGQVPQGEKSKPRRARMDHGTENSYGRPREEYTSELLVVGGLTQHFLGLRSPATRNAGAPPMLLPIAPPAAEAWAGGLAAGALKGLEAGAAAPPEDLPWLMAAGAVGGCRQGGWRGRAAGRGRDARMRKATSEQHAWGKRQRGNGRARRVCRERKIERQAFSSHLCSPRRPLLRHRRLPCHLLLHRPARRRRLVLRHGLLLHPLAAPQGRDVERGCADSTPSFRCCCCYCCSRCCSIGRCGWAGT
jgi:hypothetical protein